ncbi:MAG: amidohydrolase family protein, partial [Planctomyces sp.]
VLDRLPRLRMCFAHGGGSFPGTIGRITHGLHARPDLFPAGAKEPAAYLARDGAPARVWVDSLTHDARALGLLVEMFSARRVALGTDYPFPLGEDVAGELIASMGFDAMTAGMLRSGAAREFLGAGGGARRGNVQLGKRLGGGGVGMGWPRCERGVCPLRLADSAPPPFGNGGGSLWTMGWREVLRSGQRAGRGRVYVMTTARTYAVESVHEAVGVTMML